MKLTGTRGPEDTCVYKEREDGEENTVLDVEGNPQLRKPTQYGE